MSTTTPVIIPHVAVVNGQAKTDSLIVAEHFGKQHKDVVRKIENLDCSPEFNRRNFAPVEYTDAKGEKRPAYEMTRDGFTFLVMGFTGKEAAKWKEAYIDAFNRVEAALSKQPLPKPGLPPRLDLLSRRFLITFNLQGEEQVTLLDRDQLIVRPSDLTRMISSDLEAFPGGSAVAVSIIGLALRAVEPAHLPEVLHRVAERMAGGSGR